MRRALRKGFTLIELMVVIGIILLLISITVFGLRHANAMAARKETLAEMNICQGMLKEYASVNGTINIEGTWNTDQTGKPIQIPYPDPMAPTTTKSFTAPIYAYGISSNQPATGTSPSYISINDSAGSPTGDMSDRGGAVDGRYSAIAVARTQAVMFILLKDSRNRAALSAVSPKRILEGPLDANNVRTSYPGDYSVVLDGWGNPIIYVPKGGMLVWMNPSGSAGTNYLVRSSGLFLAKPDGTFALGTASNANDAPFWASAGQDGIFTDPQSKTDNAIDNIYSFQTQ